MQLGIDGSFNWWSLVSFEKAIGGPGIKFFESRNYGAGLDHLSVELSLRGETGPKRDFTMYRKDPGRAQFCLFLGPEIKAIEEVDAFRAIASQMYDGLERGFKRKKIPDFDYVAFLSDLKTYVTDKAKIA
jgi:hypothetical protein